MGCGISSTKVRSQNLIEMPNQKATHEFSLRKYKRVNPKYFKLTEGLFQVYEVTPSREMSFVTVSFTQ